MRRILDIALWLVILAVPAIVVAAAGGEDAWSAIEREFIDSLGMMQEDGATSASSGAVGEAWFLFFRDLQRFLGLPGFLGYPTCILLAWILIAVSVAVGVVASIGNLAGALAVLLLAVHPVARTLGAAMTPWLPAAVFTLIGVAFLQAMALPTIQRRRRSAGRVLPRVFAIVGCGLSWGLASSAEARIGWLMLVPGFLLILSVVAVGLTLWRLRDHGGSLHGLLVNPWAIVRRTMPWAACWFFVLVLFVWIYDLLQPAATERFHPIPAITTLEQVLAWAVVPGMVLLAWREGELLGYRSQLGGRTVLFVCLVSFFVIGPAMRAAAGPLERLLQAPALAISVAALSRWRS
ncbi:MAG: hypothetical protein H6832_16995 [Planctomycetes bacterium]|nr:hypothetical protein [Planctomycetota bacterium]MCB9890677.1 hypothetical protein [Planctomycetota bacterium]MCB9920100.1 hypothetical protein [Planctomycetota bacterium]